MKEEPSTSLRKILKHRWLLLAELRRAISCVLAHVWLHQLMRGLKLVLETNDASLDAHVQIMRRC